MLFAILKIYARFCLRIWCRRLVVNQPQYLRAKGPLLFAANHPNSFLDGIILTILMEETLYSLARGDAFTPRWNKWLRRIHLLPVYRTSEGVENLAQNYATFSACHEVFEQNGVVLIFSEGRCVNEWKLRSLRKGTARLATSAWEKGIDLTVVPLGFNYSSFHRFGKTVHLLFGEPLPKEHIMAHAQEGKQYAWFNQELQKQLKQLVYDIGPGDLDRREKLFAVPVPAMRRLMLAAPAVLGWVLHAPLYYPIRWVAARFDTDHFDSVVVALLMMLYPFYLVLVTITAGRFLSLHALWLLPLIPFCAWALVQLLPQVPRNQAPASGR